MPRPPRYRIHPAIGVARVGNAPASDFFLGPERPGQAVTGDPTCGTTVPPFKSAGSMKRQAVRFRVWEYVEAGGVWSPSREVTLADKDVDTLTWTVHVANRKASFFKFNGLSGSPLLIVQPAQHRRNAGAARRTLEIDPLPRSISGKLAPAVRLDQGGSSSPARELWPNPQPVPAITSLGELRTDAEGRLVVVPAEGLAAGRIGASIDEYANNDGWFDDVCDGPIRATLRLKDSNGKLATHAVEGAWVLVGPPDFAPDVPSVVSLHDLLFDLAVREMTLPSDESAYLTGDLVRMSAMAKDLGSGASTFTTYKVSFDADVAPILRSALAVSSFFGPAQHKHASFGGNDGVAALWPLLSDPSQPSAMRAQTFKRLRKSATAGRTPSDDMPRLLGDDPYDDRGTGRIGLSLTITQYAILERWAAAAFTKSALGPASFMRPVAEAHVTPHGLDRAALEAASGGGFYPGIEVGWLIREPAVFSAPFRIKPGARSTYVGDRPGTTVGAGYFSRQMALPWLADFLQCKSEEQVGAVPPSDWGWWPSQRPDAVYATPGEAAKRGAMVPWHRAAVGPSSAWPASGDGPTPRPPEMPSYTQLIGSWWKLGIVTYTPGSGYAEADRAGAVP